MQGSARRTHPSVRAREDERKRVGTDRERFTTVFFRHHVIMYRGLGKGTVRDERSPAQIMCAGTPSLLRDAAPTEARANMHTLRCHEARSGVGRECVCAFVCANTVHEEIRSLSPCLGS